MGADPKIVTNTFKTKYSSYSVYYKCLVNATLQKKLHTPKNGQVFDGL